VVRCMAVWISPAALFPFLVVASCATAQAPAQSGQVQSAVQVRPGVEKIPLNQPTAKRLEARKSSYKVTVSGDDWADTQLTVAPGDSVEITASGDVSLSDSRKVTPDGTARGWKDLLRQFPDNSSPAGALVGRIGNTAATVPFNVGASKTLHVPTSGELYLRINVSSDLTATGSYSVTLHLSHDSGPATAQAASEATLTNAISPALFASVPRRVQDKQGDLGDMVNFAMIGTEDQVKKAFENAGWVTVDATNQDAVVHGLLATLQHQSYLEMPMSTLYLFNRPQDLSYARADPITVAAERHHLRIWKSTETVDGKPMWVGSSTHDIGFEKDQRNNGVTHKIDPDIDKERDFIEQSFAAAGNLQAAAYVTPSEPLTEAKTATGGSFHSDGRIVVLLLK
jgi:LssY C-terminus